MARETIVVGKVLLAALFAGAVLAQTVVLPWMAAEVVSVFPEVRNLQRPILVLAVLVMACVELVLICIWRLLTLVQEDRFHGPGIRYLDVVVAGLLIAAALMATILAVITEADQGTGGPIPPLALLVGMGGCTAAALIVLVMRRQLHQAMQQQGHRAGIG